MTTLHWVPRINATPIQSATPTISTSPAYTSGDQLGGIMELINVVRQDSNMGYGVSELAAITILDGSKQDAAIDIWFFNVSPTVTSSDNAAFAMTLANQQLQCIGQVSIGVAATPGAYSDASAVSTSSNPNLNLPLRVPGTASVPTSIFAIAIVRGTPTYTTTTAVKFIFSFYAD